MSSERQPSRPPDLSGAGAPAADPRTAEVAAWIGQFSRTLKTCRLYDAKNPTSIKFREDLGARFVAMLETHGAIALEFTASEVRFDGQAVIAARGREDNFAMPFYRDGLRRLTFQPGATAAELETLVDLLLRVTSHRSSGGEDLVTLMWDADLMHVDMRYVSSETDADLGEQGEHGEYGDDAPAHASEAPGERLPWPGGGGGNGGGAGDGGAVSDGSGPGFATTSTGVTLELISEENTLPLRSEDWLASDPVHELEACYEELEPLRAEESERFTREMLAERAEGLVTRTLALMRSALTSELRDDDRIDFAALLERLLRESIGNARWREARETVECLADLAGGNWDSTALVNELTQPESFVTAAVVRHLDAGGGAELGEFDAFVRVFGAPASQWLMCIVSLAGHQRTRRTLLRSITGLCDGDTRNLAPWLSDERWYVVRNAVMVVGSAEGGAPPELLRPLLKHEEPRVRQEVVSALNRLHPDVARPLLLEFLADSEPAVRSAAMFQLGARRNPEAADALLRIVTEPGFRKRPSDEIRSVTSALGGCGGDEVLPALEQQLASPHWFAGGDAAHAQAIGRCIARIGTPAALAALERAASGRPGAARDACRLVLKGMGRG